MKHSRFLGQPLAILPSALDVLEDMWAAGPGQSQPRAALSPPQTGASIRVIGLNGPIMSGLPTWLAEAVGAADPVVFAAQVRAAAADPEVTGIVLMVDSPGGSVTAVDDAATAVREAQARKPVIAYAPDMACSAAYWAISGAQQIITSSTGMIGSVGSYLRWSDQSAAAAQEGVTVHVYRSSPGKAPGQPGEAHSPQVDEAMSSMVDAVQAVFSAAVAAGRGVPLATVQEQYATGRVWVGEHAVAAGIADRIGTFADAVQLAGGSMAPPKKSNSGGTRMTAAQLAALGLNADATEAEIMAAIEVRNIALARDERRGGRVLAALGYPQGQTLPEGTVIPADPLAALSAQAADGRAYREAQLDRIHALTITAEGNDAAGIQAADDARAVYSGQSMTIVAAQIARLEAKRDSLPNGPLSKQPSDKETAPKPLQLSAYGVGRR